MQVFLLDSPDALKTHLAKQLDVHNLVDDWHAVSVRDNQRLPTQSAKAYFFPEQENLFVFDGECFRETRPEPEPFVLFGLHSCDLTAIAYQDQFFAEDPYYQARRQQALLVGIDCTQPCAGGFCPVVQAGPGVDPQHADLILHRINNNQWQLIVSNNKGQKAIKDLPLTLAGADALTEREYNIERCTQAFDTFDYLHAGINAVQHEQTIPLSFWEPLGLQCLSCSGCTTLCPTCSCYATRDINNNNTVQQQRFWDSCLYESFQREASRQNPSATAGARVKRFWTHKFAQQFTDTFGRYGCVGCGRCEQTCPGVIGVHSVMKRVSSYVQSDPDQY